MGIGPTPETSCSPTSSTSQTLYMSLQSRCWDPVVNYFACLRGIQTYPHLWEKYFTTAFLTLFLSQICSYISCSYIYFNSCFLTLLKVIIFMRLAFVAFWRRYNFSVYAASNNHVTRTRLRSLRCCSVLLFIYYLINDAYFEISLIVIRGSNLGRFKPDAFRTFRRLFLNFPWKICLASRENYNLFYWQNRTGVKQSSFPDFVAVCS